jgi:endonuclease/exonuclease/phosphatase family metal-dependent hydrolase
MVRKILLLFLFLFMGSVFVFSQNTLTVVSYNIWFDNPTNTDDLWSERKAGVIETLQEINPDIFCVQEALINQVYDLEFGTYQHAGVGRDDGKKAGEFAAIYYDTARFEKIDGSTFWLSENPETPGEIGWDAVCVRIVTWVHLKEFQSGKNFYIFNTHFDHIGDTARLESAKLIKQKTSEIAGHEPVILTGDFNCKTGSYPYQILVARNSEVHFNDTRFASKETVSGPDYSFVGSDFTGKPGDIIDHIFITNHLEVENAGIVLNCDTKCPSDHLPVFVELSVIQ